ncbi:MAG: bifunctional ADP-dependent NAD(P)H-hydrate dehydratase/NAD(P)H-hydrate epimerase, partial [Acidimicrobiia bacterium]|nr:bifunctional ADP-dependent NAD(P)H-hydrate dehydratase/NAD(P)H-hydrate epimerase [Acidimicrobiia bacterium]
MIPVVTPEEMKAVDEAAPEPTDVLVHRAGGAVTRMAIDMLGGVYGRRVAVVAGKGNNGADGRDAAARLSRRGMRVHLIEAADAPARLPDVDLVIDAAYGTGFHGEYEAPDPGGAPVLAVDIPSGVNGLTGEAADGAAWADRTVTFAALKPGLLLGAGRDRAGLVEVVDIGLDVSGATAALVEGADVAEWLPRRERETHKWKTSAWVAAGSPGMTGAAEVCSRSALRAGAGLVRLGIPGLDAPPVPLEVVGRPLPRTGWDDNVLDELDRFHALIVGPGLGRSDEQGDAVRGLLERAQVPAVVDADGLYALEDVDRAAEVIGKRAHPTVLTPHEGEFAHLSGETLGADRIDAARRLAASTGATVLLKGSTTTVADP